MVNLLTASILYMYQERFLTGSFFLPFHVFLLFFIFFLFCIFFFCFVLMLITSFLERYVLLIKF